MTGTLYIVSTPIGNLEDITFRAIRIFKEVALIAAEDTRHTKNLLNHFDIHTPLTSYHDFNKEEKTVLLIARLKENDSIALVSDAGTPTISDPGYYLIKKAIEEKIVVCPLPGPTALIAALSVSGLPTDRFIFEGFLPRKKGARFNRLDNLKEDARTIIFYESPYRIVSLLEEIASLWGEERSVSVGRELTKVFEETIRGNVAEVLIYLKSKKVKGEIVLVVEGVRPLRGVRPQREARARKRVT